MLRMDGNIKEYLSGKNLIYVDILVLYSLAAIFPVCYDIMKRSTSMSWLMKIIFATGSILLTVLVCFLSVHVVCNLHIPDDMGMNRNGIYKFSRNPMYAAYFICFAGMAVLTRSLVLLAVVMVFQVSAHWIILAEERWCMEKFGTAYGQYMKEVRRYI